MNSIKVFDYRLSRFIILSMALLVPFYLGAENSQDYEEIEWTQLMPKDDLDALLNPPDFLSDVQDGSEQDSIEALSEATSTNKAARRFQQALTSVRVIEDFANKLVRVPGFVVPIKSDEKKRVIEFFIVPYFGACLHMPPPPPNQMIYGKFEGGLELSQLNLPFWFEGAIQIETTHSVTGTSAYGMRLDNIQAYE